MSDEELERLAAAMKDIKPSDKARHRGMAAAMEAFDAEFAADNEKISTDIQGTVREPRPTAQTPKRSGIMSKFTQMLPNNPRATMMLGSCAAALMFAVVIIPQTDLGLPQEFETVATEVGAPDEAAAKSLPSVTKQVTRRMAAESDEIVVTGSRRSSSTSSVAVKPIFEDLESAALEEYATDDGFAQANQQNAPLPMVRALPDGGQSEKEALMDVAGGNAALGYSDNYIVEPGYREPPSRDRFEAHEVNPVTSVQETPVSTFSIDVDTASYAFMRASINAGQIPQPGAIRIEELVNYFPYDYEPPRSAAEPFKANVSIMPSPWNADTKLMRIGIKGYVPPAIEKPRSNIVLLIDTSGSMDQRNKLPLLINSFKLLLNTLDEDDTVSIVTYAGSAGTVLEPTAATEKDKIHAALNRLRAGGSTAGAAGLELAYMKAEENFDDEGINRIFIATDGDFNVGFSSPEDMKRFVEKKRRSGIFLSVLGFGMGNYNDALMQSLAQNGNGVAAYIDSLSEANKVLADESGSALITIAKDVKIQVEFNPATVAEYRLIGYESRALKREDFNNDKVDAGEINSGHSVTAIYEMTPVGSPAVTVDDLRYARAEETKPTLASASEEFAFVKIRHKLPNADKSTLQTFPIGTENEVRVNRANEDMRFATAVAAVGQKLRGDTQLADYSYADVIELAISGKGEDAQGYRAEFIQLVRLLDTMDK